MAIKIGTTSITDVGKIKLGSTNITKVYQGVNQIWPTTVITSYSFSVKLGTTTSNVCSATPITIYSDVGVWGSGEMSLWLDAALTIGLSGYNYGVLSSETLIYGISSSIDYQYLNGSTHGNCSTASYSYSVKLGTTLTNVCTATPTTVYSDSSTWTVGMILAGLGDAIYIVQTINNDIYEIVWDGSTGASPSYLGNDTGNNCTTLTDVTITACGTNPDGAGVVTLYAYASQAVDTSVSVEIRWTGDLFTQLTGTAIISSGQSIGSVTVSPTLTGENFVSLEILSITPASSSTQNYIEGSVSGGTCTS
jgi:hypothetical protein